MSDWANLAIAVCAVLGFIVSLIAMGVGYGMFKGRSAAVAENAKAATARMFERIEAIESNVADARSELASIREILIARKVMLPGSPPSQLPHMRRQEE